MRNSTLVPKGRTTSTERTNPVPPTLSGCSIVFDGGPQSGPALSRTCTMSPLLAGVWLT